MHNAASHLFSIVLILAVLIGCDQTEKQPVVPSTDAGGNLKEESPDTNVESRWKWIAEGSMSNMGADGVTVKEVIKDGKHVVSHSRAEGGLGKMPFVGGSVVVDYPGSRNIHVTIDPEVKSTTYAGLTFTEPHVLGIRDDGTLVADEEGVSCKDNDDRLWVSRKVKLDGGEVIAFFPKDGEIASVRSNASEHRSPELDRSDKLPFHSSAARNRDTEERFLDQLGRFAIVNTKGKGSATGVTALLDLARQLSNSEHAPGTRLIEFHYDKKPDGLTGIDGILQVAAEVSLMHRILGVEDRVTTGTIDSHDIGAATPSLNTINVQQTKVSVPVTWYEYGWLSVGVLDNKIRVIRANYEEPAELVAPKESSTESRSRVWTEASGGRTIQASLLDLQDGIVHIRRDDGREFNLPLDRFSKDDQRWVTSEIARRSHASSNNKTVAKLPSESEPAQWRRDYEQFYQRFKQLVRDEDQAKKEFVGKEVEWTLIFKELKDNKDHDLEFSGLRRKLTEGGVRGPWATFKPMAGSLGTWQELEPGTTVNIKGTVKNLFVGIVLDNVTGEQVPWGTATIVDVRIFP